MSTVFASDVDGWDDEPMQMVSPYSESNNEGYSGNPSHYIDIEENPDFYFRQKEIERFEQSNFEKNISVVKDCMTCGIVLPSKVVLPKIIEKLKSISVVCR